MSPSTLLRYPRSPADDRAGLLDHARAVAAISVRETDPAVQAARLSFLTRKLLAPPLVYSSPVIPSSPSIIPPGLEICPGCGWRRLQRITERVIAGDRHIRHYVPLSPYWLCLRCWWERSADPSGSVPRY